MRPINVVSSFDGMGGLIIALKTLGIKINKYFAIENDKFAIRQTSYMFPEIIHLGDITKVKMEDFKGEKIDLFAGGSPCKGFSFAGKQLNFNDPESKLFFEYVRLLNQIKKNNPDVKFLLENVVMKKKYQKVINEMLGIRPVMINSALVSAQNRKRLYWTNIKTRKEGLFGELITDISQPEDRGILLKDILLPESEVSDKFILSEKLLKSFLNKPGDFGQRFKPQIDEINSKGACLTANTYKIQITSDFIRIGCVKMGRTDEAKKIRRESMKNGKDYTPFQAKQINSIDYDKMNTITCATTKYNILTNGYKFRRLTPIECARLQTIPEWYKWEPNISDTQKYKMLGNGWTNDVITHILSFYEQY